MIDTESQVCNLIFCKHSNQLISSHGYSMNEIILWNYPNMTKVSTLTGHTTRVLFLSMSPDARTIVSGAGDETLRFWSIQPPEVKQKKDFKQSILLENIKELR
eukprot:TRINITY_DN665_c0_g1_i1.p5 TRINITY_DN665_c0_g1~~TRINITY_DN665_c0_g1_i1.p5  ORF type:complete len:103 (+),score=16.45 TRINITY_DN665_c0_g1_i1:821-1129(+)